MAAEFRSGVASLRMPDALILATAETNTDVDLIVTGDAQPYKVPGLDCAVSPLR